ncbi:MAG: GyrI-like domain-containing protein [Clostridiaceae bacterium]
METPYEFVKQEERLYQPGNVPELIDVPEMVFLAVDGRGNPNEQEGAYAKALELLYALSYTIKMSPKSGHAIQGYFEYRVPPLEGLWQMEHGAPGVDYQNKAGFEWTSMIRQPAFVTQDVFDWASFEVLRKKKIETTPARLFVYREGLCVQCMHIGAYDDEPATVEKMDRFVAEQGYRNDMGKARRHHEIYLGDPRKTAPEKRKTVIRHPVVQL